MMLIFNVNKKDISITESFYLVLEKFLPFLGLVIAVSVLITVIYIYIFSVLEYRIDLLGVDFEMYIILFVVFYILLFFLMFPSYPLLLENKGILTSIATSSEYIKGYNLMVFVRLLILFIITITSLFIIERLRFQSFELNILGNELELTLSHIIYSFWGVIMMIFSTIYSYLIYLD